MRNVLLAAAAVEVGTGLALIGAPSLVARLLLGAEVLGTGMQVARVAGIALVGLGIACWPGRARVGMLFYSAGVGVYLAFLGVAGVASGVLLWPAVVLHTVFTLLLARDQGRKP